MDGIVIIGAGECGTRAAFATREAGYVGPITLIGGELHLPYERPPLSKPSDGIAQMKAICTAEALEAASIQYRQGCAVTAIDVAARSIKMTDGTTYRYDKLLLATGASPRRLSCRGSDLALGFRTYSDAGVMFEKARGAKSVAIIGGGLIGMELASVLRRRGIAVSIVEAASKPLGRAVPRRFAQMLHARHVEEGVAFHLGQGVEEIKQNSVVLADGTVLPADVVVAAIGVVPNVELAESAGIATSNGIVTDACLRTGAPDVFAAGDCASVLIGDNGHMRFESWRNARKQAETASRNMLGGEEAFVATPWFWSDQYDFSLQVVGIPMPGQQTIVRHIADGAIEFYLDGGRLVAAAGLGVGNGVAKDIKLAEMLIDARATPDPSKLADPVLNLKELLRDVRSAQAAA
ncbi:NAD(P)/FAD-dependent oxidoreductase [Rhizobium tubonense]|uniref:Ferredoxin reductase n=1 Tax=Rhizobium tubonense TaxID=484088 RepID=A0A2W4CPR0_9HYPH|nr:FAD-dependent oxidoreductase [Rhizobium tubonense]PZM14589.1 ferredoxin reductase [Rhizobium tubonense]